MFWPLQLSSEFSGVPEDSNSHFRECEWQPHTSLKVGLWHLSSLAIEEKWSVLLHLPLCILMQHSVLPQEWRKVQSNYSLPFLPSSRLQSSPYAIVPWTIQPNWLFLSQWHWLQTIGFLRCNNYLAKMLQLLPMLLVTFTSQKCAPLQGYTLNLAYNVLLSFLHSSLYTSNAGIIIPFAGNLKI